MGNPIHSDTPPRNLQMMHHPVAVFLTVLMLMASPHVGRSAPMPSAAASIRFIGTQMDLYHRTYDVSTDVSAPGNHFHALALFPDESAPVGINGSWEEAPHSGATCLRAQFTRTSNRSFGGYIFQNGVLPVGERVPIPN